MKTSTLHTRGFAATRTRFGLSQRQLAQELGISKATVSMAETGRRNLPVAALLKFAELEIKTAAALVSSTPCTINQGRTALSTSGRCDMEIRELQCELQIQKLTRLLQTRTLQYERFQQQLQLLNGMLDNDTNNPGSMFHLCLQLQRERVLKQLTKCSPTEQALLRNRIALLSAESHLNKSVRRQFED